MNAAAGHDGGYQRSSLAGPAVITLITGDNQHPEVRRAAEAHAREHGCVLILFASDVASWWSEPMPNQWASDGEGDRFGDRLGPEDLEVLGQSAIADQIREGRRAGVRASAWLPKDHGVEALAAYAVAQGAHLVLVSESLDSIDELRPLLAATEGVDGVPRPAIELHVVALADAGMPPSDTSDPGAKVS
jgi:hypothetical protein